MCVRERERGAGGSTIGCCRKPMRELCTCGMEDTGTCGSSDCPKAHNSFGTPFSGRCDWNHRTPRGPNPTQSYTWRSEGAVVRRDELAWADLARQHHHRCSEEKFYDDMVRVKRRHESAHTHTWPWHGMYAYVWFVSFSPPRVTLCYIYTLLLVSSW